MAFQLALGCRTVGYDQVHRRCCNNIDPTTCNQCVNFESVSIAGSSSFTNTCTCSTGVPVVDGTYSYSFLNGSSACFRNRSIHNQNCSGGGLQVVGVSVSLYLWNIPKPFETLPSPNSIIVPYPYYSPGRGFRAIVVVAYDSRFRCGFDRNDTHAYLRDFETCPEGTQSIPLLTSYNASAPAFGSTAPSDVFITWPIP